MLFSVVYLIFTYVGGQDPYIPGLVGRQLRRTRRNSPFLVLLTFISSAPINNEAYDCRRVQEIYQLSTLGAQSLLVQEPVTLNTFLLSHRRLYFPLRWREGRRGRLLRISWFPVYVPRFYLLT